MIAFICIIQAYYKNKSTEWKKSNFILFNNIINIEWFLNILYREVSCFCYNIKILSTKVILFNFIIQLYVIIRIYQKYVNIKIYDTGAFIYFFYF